LTALMSCFAIGGVIAAKDGGVRPDANRNNRQAIARICNVVWRVKASLDGFIHYEALHSFLLLPDGGA
jgi:hypothetical protein